MRWWRVVCLPCRRRQVVAMTTLALLLALAAYTLALASCLGQGSPQVVQYDVREMEMAQDVHAMGLDQPAHNSLVGIGAQAQGVAREVLAGSRKLQFDPAAHAQRSPSLPPARLHQPAARIGKQGKRPGPQPLSSLASSSLSSLLKSSLVNSRTAGVFGVNSENASHGGGQALVDVRGVLRHHRTLQNIRTAGSAQAAVVNTMTQEQQPRERSPYTSSTDSESDELGGMMEGGVASALGPGQEYRGGPRDGAGEDMDTVTPRPGGVRNASAAPGVPQDVHNVHNASEVRDASGLARRLPSALIIGVKKAGTRALLEFLRLHPDVAAPGPEPHFFDKHYHKGLEYYRSLMPPSRPDQVTVEKTPSYFVTREAPRRVQRMAPGVRLVLVLRDPVTRAVSDYVQASTKGGESSMKSFEDMALLDARLGIVNTSWGAIRIGVYTKHLERWLRHFPREHLHLVSGEDLIRDPAGVMRGVQDFLGLRPFLTPAHFSVNATRGLPCLVRRPEQHSRPHCLGKTKGRRHPHVQPGVTRRLHDFYRPFNRKLYQMTGRDFGWP